MEIYIHIPFCAKKCGYCDFLSFPADEEAERAYTDSLLAEIRQNPNAADAREEVSSIFIGGGTPSVLPASYIEEILAAVRERHAAADDAEITIEANPGTVDMEKLLAYRRAGINRISFGCQSADDRELKLLGRIHTWADFQESFHLAREAGFTNINADLMSALPGQRLSGWESTLRKTAELSPEHISAYSLIIEEGTPFRERYGDGEGRRMLPDEDEERRMYERTAEILSEYGFHRYEISNYAREGKECRHNIGYWTGVPYIGFGLGASSYRNRRRWKNTDSFRKYLEGDYRPRDEESLSQKDMEAEYMILGLRLARGVSDSEFARRFGRELEEAYGTVLRKYVKMGLMTWENGYAALTAPGISVSNRILADIYCEE